MISPSSSMFSCLSDSTNSYFRYFETQRGKAEGAILYIFCKRLSWLKDCFFQLLYVYRKWQATVLTLLILCLCHLPNVLSTAGWIPNRCFLLLIFLFFSITPFTRVSCQRPTLQNFFWNDCGTIQVYLGMMKVYAPLLCCLKKQGCFLNLSKRGVTSLKTVKCNWKGNCIPWSGRQQCLAYVLLRM